jgi:hypothetical protein
MSVMSFCRSAIRVAAGSTGPALGGPGRDHHGLGAGERLVKRLGEERGDRVQEPDQRVEDVPEHRAGAVGGAAGAADGGELGLGQLQVPVAQLVPREVVERLGGLGELEVLQQLRRLGCHCLRSAPDPAVGQREPLGRGRPVAEIVG